MTNTNEQVERRKHKRLQVPAGTLVGIGPDFTKVGLLTDLSMDGLAFRYAGGGERANGPYLEIFLTEGHSFLVLLDNVPFRIISDVEIVEKTPSSSTTMRRCCVKFKKLTPQQMSQLEQFIQDHTSGEA